MTPGVYRLPCRCVYNRRPVDANGNCEGCGFVRDDAWYKRVLAGRVGTRTRKDDSVPPPTPSSVADDDPETLWNFEEKESE